MALVYIIFKEELSGPEYAGRFIDEVNGTDIDILLDTMVIEITEDKQVFCTSESHGYMVLQGKALILNMGCRERTRGAIAIPGDRPAGCIYSRSCTTLCKYRRLHGRKNA